MNVTATCGIRWLSFSQQKDGNAPDEYEDAVAGDPMVGRFAIADGASESSFVAQWARLLVEGFVATPDRDSSDWLLPLQKRWAESVDQLELDWFGEEKREQGAFATFLGLDVLEGSWQAVAVGDCCLFQVRSESLLASFPVESSTEFGNRPPLLGSRAGGEGLAQAKRTAGRWQNGDRMWVMTDALAEWFVKQHEQQRKPWDFLFGKMSEPNAMNAYIEQLRGQKELKNDDVTLVLIDL